MLISLTVKLDSVLIEYLYIPLDCNWLSTTVMVWVSVSTVQDDRVDCDYLSLNTLGT